MISGVGVCFALRHRDRGQFFRERSIRLLVPLVFGILVLVPPMVYLEKRFLGEVAISFAEFYPQVFTKGVYPTGHLSWHHYWFIAYLYLFCLLGWSVFAYINSAEGAQRMVRWCTRMTRSAGLYLPIGVLLLVEIPLRPLFPGFRDLIHDWASFAHWFVVFVLGYLFANDVRLLDRALALRCHSLVVAMLTTSILFWQFSDDSGAFTPLNDGQVSVWEYLWFCLVRMTNAWCWLLVCLGFAARYLNKPSSALRYLTQAVYPLFCLHLTIIVTCAYVVVPLSWPIGAKYLAITTATLVLTFVLYEFVVRRIPGLPVLFGLKTNG